MFSMAGVAIGTWLLIFVLSASNGFEGEVKNQLMGKDAHFELTHFQYEPLGSYDTLLQFVKKNPEVTAASPYIMSQAVFARKKKFTGGVVFGIDPIASQKVIALKKTMTMGEYNLEPMLDTSGQKIDRIIMGYALAARLGVGIGEKCLLYVFSDGAGFGTSFTPRAKVFVLAGTFESGMYQFDEALAYIKLSAAQDAFSMPNQITGVHAQVKNPMQSGKVAVQLEQKLGYPFAAVDWQEKNRTLIKWMDYEKVLMGLALGIIIIIAAFNIISSLVMNVSDKKREVGILRAMGATRSQIARIFVLQGALVGFVGSCIGVLLGLISCWLQMKYGIIQLPGDVYFVTVLPVSPQFLDIVWVIFITFLLCVVAAFLPALQASRQNPVAAIRYE